MHCEPNEQRATWKWVPALAGIFVLSSLTFVACDPGVSIEGSVSNELGQPVNAAEALVQCPDLCVYGSTDSRGRLSGSKIGECPLDCKLTVRAAGYEPFSHVLKPYCVDVRRGLCRRVRADLRLKRASSAGGR
jgi:hypothetical protein